MAQWRKVVVSGSTAELNDISASGHIVPVTADGGALGSAKSEWSDLYLADSSVINFGADQDTTLTHTDGSGIALNSTNKLGFGGNFNAYIQHDGTDLKLSDDADINLVAGADILLDAATTIKIDSAAGDVSFEDAGTAQLAIDMDGTAGQIDVQLKVASDDLVFKTQGGNEVIRVADDRKLYFFDQGGEHISSDGSILSIAAGAELHISSSMVDIGANTISGSHASSGSFGYLNVHGDAIIKGDLTFGDANTDLITIGADIGSNLTPNTDATYDLGTTSQGWNDLHLGSGGVINLDGGDVTLTHAAGKLTWGGDGAVEIDFNNHEMTNVDIDSGAIDGTTIGAASHTTGKFTTLIATGDVDLGDATGDTITATGRFDSALVPSTDSARDLGTTGLYWANAYIDSITTTGDVTVNGSLDVNGTLTTIDSTNLRVADRFIIVASGSTSGDSGLIANTGAGGIGSAFFYDDSASRWALTAADDTSGSATTATPRQYLVSVSQSAAPPDDWEGGATQNPSDFGTDAATRRGMIYVQTSDHAGSRTLAGDIWIWS